MRFDYGFQFRHALKWIWKVGGRVCLARATPSASGTCVKSRANIRLRPERIPDLLAISRAPVTIYDTLIF